MVCAPIITTKTCPLGFERDVQGCLTDICIVPEPGQITECEQDSQCVQIPADCCGCSAGGADRAVAAERADSELEALECPDNPTCPDVNACDEAEVPQCLAGRCVLAISVGEDVMNGVDALCGTPELGACDDGMECVLNAISSKDASELGVGSCQPAP